MPGGHWYLCPRYSYRHLWKLCFTFGLQHACEPFAAVIKLRLDDRNSHIRRSAILLLNTFSCDSRTWFVPKLCLMLEPDLALQVLGEQGAAAQPYLGQMIRLLQTVTRASGVALLKQS